MPPSVSQPLARLRSQIAAIAPPARHGVLALDGGCVDAALGGGLALGALHEAQGAGIEAETCAIPAAFLAKILARMPTAKPVFWISPVADLYAPGLIGLGFDPARLIQLRSASDDEALAAMETLLRSKAAACVVTEAGKIGPLAGRRLQMACLGSGCTGFILRRWPHGKRAAEPVAAAVTRWRLGPSPSAKDGHAPGRPRWHVELLHTRAGPPGEWILEQEDRHDAPHPFRLAAEMAHPPLAARRLAG